MLQQVRASPQKGICSIAVMGLRMLVQAVIKHSATDVMTQAGKHSQCC